MFNSSYSSARFACVARMVQGLQLKSAAERGTWGGGGGVRGAQPPDLPQW